MFKVYILVGTKETKEEAEKLAEIYQDDNHTLIMEEDRSSWVTDKNGGEYAETSDGQNN